MKKEEIKDTVLKSKLFNFTINSNVLMWELEMEIFQLNIQFICM